MFWLGVLTGVLQGVLLYLTEKLYAPEPIPVPTSDGTGNPNPKH